MCDPLAKDDSLHAWLADGQVMSQIRQDQPSDANKGVLFGIAFLLPIVCSTLIVCFVVVLAPVLVSSSIAVFAGFVGCFTAP